MRGTRYSDVVVAQVCYAACAALRAAREQDGDGAVLLLSRTPPPAEAEAVRDGRLGCTPRLRHGTWLARMIRDGWGPGPDDPAAMTHPDIRPYADLSQDRRDADRLWLAIVTTLTLTE